MNEKMELNIAAVEAMSEIERLANVVGIHDDGFIISNLYDIRKESNLTSMCLQKVVGGFAYVRYDNRRIHTTPEAKFRGLHRELIIHRNRTTFPV